MMNGEIEEKPKSEEPFFLSMLPFAGLGLLLVAALVWRYLPDDSAPPSSPPPPPAEDLGKAAIDYWDQGAAQEISISASDFTLGPENAPVTVVEFSDFECPFCRAGATAVKEILDKHPAEVRLVFKNFPLDTLCNDALAQQLHPFACSAAILARCAGRSNKKLFWETHDALFRASELSGDVLSQILVELSLPTDQIGSCMTATESMAKVKQDVAEGRKLGVTGTPTFFVNGRRVSEYTNGALLRLVEHVLAKPPQS